jgi:hypothetical protein
MDEINTDDIWTVADSNAKDPRVPRTHAVNLEVSYDFYPGKGVPMPRHHAAVFLKDPAFRVTSAAGVRMTPLPQVEADAAQARKLALEPDEAVAKFSELTDGALLARVASRPGGEKIAAGGDREAMIAFLKTAPRVAELARHERARDTGMVESDYDPEGDLMGDDTMAKAMLIRDGSVGARDPLAMGG